MKKCKFCGTVASEEIQQCLVCKSVAFDSSEDLEKRKRRENFANHISDFMYIVFVTLMVGIVVVYEIMKYLACMHMFHAFWYCI